MFYHVLIETTEKIGKQGEFRELYELDNTDLKEIEKDIVYPYLKGEQFQFDGYFINPKDVRRFLIKETQKTTEVLAKFENDRMPPGVLFIVDRKDIVSYDEHTTDLTKDILSRIRQELDHIDSRERGIMSNQNEIDKTKVFIVHGHDRLMKTEIARFVEMLGYEAIILHEKPSKGKTIIEKIEEYSNVGFGLVLYSPCDVGSVASEKPDLKPRARQNVVFEHGYLIGKLNRENVIAIVKGQLERPNDISGVVYIPMENGDWKIQVTKEMRASGYDVDMNKILNT